MNKLSDKKKGFTIIEVVVVLAIAGLIFGIVFWALPNLQKSNRDSSRRTVASNVLANLDQYASNNNGQYPAEGTEFETFLTQFFTDGIADPLAGDYGSAEAPIDYHGGGSESVDDGDGDTYRMLYGTSARCETGVVGSMEDGVGSRAVAIAVELEQGIGYCVDNNS